VFLLLLYIVYRYCSRRLIIESYRRNEKSTRPRTEVPQINASLSINYLALVGIVTGTVGNINHRHPLFSITSTSTLIRNMHMIYPYLPHFFFCFDAFANPMFFCQIIGVDPQIITCEGIFGKTRLPTVFFLKV
jgi:hypothetical protein